MRILYPLLLLTLFTSPGRASEADLEREKAMREPYANDFGPKTLEADYLKTLSKQAQNGYKAFQLKCTQCHEAARPLNSQFVETAGSSKKERADAAQALRKTRPELFQNKALWQIEGAIWQRYVKRMMNKPGCDVSKEEGKLIWMFLSEDSRKRKLGREKEWSAHRAKLLLDFKKNHPKRYRELYP